MADLVRRRRRQKREGIGDTNFTGERERESRPALADAASEPDARARGAQLSLRARAAMKSRTKSCMVFEAESFLFAGEIGRERGELYRGYMRTYTRWMGFLSDPILRSDNVTILADLCSWRVGV